MPELAGVDGAAQALRGYDAIEAAWRLLRRTGHDGGLQAFREVYGLIGSAEALAEPFEQAGIQARAAMIGPDELVYLDVPTLLQLRDGS
jgi:ATP-binding cassette, subfamily B, bacterial